jgi:hypothetical protein
VPRCLLCGHAGIRAVPWGPAAQMSALPAWFPDQLKIDDQRKWRLVKLTPHL